MNPRFLPLIVMVSGSHFAWAQAPAAPAVPAAPPAQTPGFLEIPWGSDAELIKKQFSARSHARLDRTTKSNDELQFTGGKFAGLKAAKFTLHLAADHFWKADVVFEAVSRDHQKEYVTLKQLLVEKFGSPTSETTHEQNVVAEWYLSGVPGVLQDKICLDSDIRGSGMKLFYAADRIARTPVAVPKAVDTAGKTKALPVEPKAKDDL